MREYCRVAGATWHNAVLNYISNLGKNPFLLCVFLLIGGLALYCQCFPAQLVLIFGLQAFSEVSLDFFTFEGRLGKVVLTLPLKHCFCEVLCHISHLVGIRNWLLLLEC